jgi:MoxR-like ATPase
MDPSDMFFSPQYKAGEWTSREPADWIKLMQKPWTIILFDEIDKLNDQCFERLHSLFDRSRSVYDPQLWSVKANQDCLFLWTRNSYDRLSNPILSRWRILQINYPWALNEAFKVSKYTTSSVLRKMTYDEFKMLYDKYINRWESAPTNAQEKSIYELVQNINHLLNVFNNLREQYWADEPFAFELSYRDARQIFVDYNSWWNFKEALEWVLIPKARWAVVDPDEKHTQETMVRSAINEEMWL